MRRLLWFFSGAVGAAVLLWGGQAMANHRSGETLHACVGTTGTLRASESCLVGETRVVLLAEGALARIESRLAGLESKVTTLESNVAILETANSGLQSLLSGVSRSGDTLTFSGMNLQVVNGTGRTSLTNGTGNLIIGYNEPRPDLDDIRRTGSHNLVVGDLHRYTSYGGAVFGQNSAILAPYASVTGGLHHVADGNGASISGGSDNRASGIQSSVSGGKHRTAADWYDWVAGTLWQDQ